MKRLITAIIIAAVTIAATAQKMPRFFNISPGMTFGQIDKQTEKLGLKSDYTLEFFAGATVRFYYGSLLGSLAYIYILEEAAGAAESLLFYIADDGKSTFQKCKEQFIDYDKKGYDITDEAGQEYSGIDETGKAFSVTNEYLYDIKFVSILITSNMVRTLMSINKYQQ